MRKVQMLLSLLLAMVLVLAFGWGCAEKEEAPEAGFAADTTSGYWPLQVQLTDQSKGDIDSWFWHLGNGATSSEQSPSYTYQNAGTYTASLIVAKGGDATTEVKTDYITVYEPLPEAGFTAEPTSGCWPLEVQFTDESTGTFTSWSWEFGDGATSSEQSPPHTYQTAGTYTVSLTVTHGDDSSTETKTDYISVYEPPVADFSAAPTSVGAGLSVQFTDESAGATSWQWDFDNDGTVDSTEQNPSHIYSTPGLYTVSLEVGGLGCTDTATKLEYIEVTEIGFSISLPAGWAEDSARKEERDSFFHQVKYMGVSVKGIEIKSDGWCAGFFVPPAGDAYIELHGSASPMVVPAQLAFAYTPHTVYHPGYDMVSDPIVDEENLNLIQVYTCDDGKAKELLAVREEPPYEVWFVTCVAATEEAFDGYESEFNEIIDSFAFLAVTPPDGDGEEEGGPFRITKGPYLQHVEKTGITIMWETSQEATSRVDYGVEEIYQVDSEIMIDIVPVGEVLSEELTKIHEITLTGLEEAKLYHYTVTSAVPSEEEVTSEDAVFKTAPGEDTPFTLVVYGDNRCPIWLQDEKENWTTHETIANAIAARRPDLVINTGDVVTDGNEYAHWGSELFGPANELMKDTPYYISIGNHEEDAHWYYDFVSYPEPENYYSFDYGNAHFTALDSNQPLEPGSPQYEWLQDDLQSSTATSATWRVVFWHHPAYDSIHQFELWELALRENVCPVLEDNNVDIVFNGHSHLYERSYPMKNDTIDLEEGIVYITTGGGGAELKVFSSPKKPDYIAAGVTGAFHYCVVNVIGGNFQMMVYDIDGNLIDLLTLTK